MGLAIGLMGQEATMLAKLHTLTLELKLAKLVRTAEDHLLNGVPRGGLVYHELYSQCEALMKTHQVKCNLSMMQMEAKWPAILELKGLMVPRIYGRGSLLRLVLTVILTSSVVFFILHHIWR